MLNDWCTGCTIRGHGHADRKSMFEHWLQHTGQGGTDLYAAEPEEASDDFVTDTAFDNPEGRMEVDTGMDPEFKGECPFSNADISAEDGSE